MRKGIGAIVHIYNLIVRNLIAEGASVLTSAFGSLLKKGTTKNGKYADLMDEAEDAQQNLERARLKGNKTRARKWECEYRQKINQANKLQADMLKPYTIGSKFITDYMVSGYLDGTSAYDDYTEGCKVE